jgi:hypothetical protein
MHVRREDKYRLDLEILDIKWLVKLMFLISYNCIIVTGEVNARESA